MFRLQSSFACVFNQATCRCVYQELRKAFERLDVDQSGGRSDEWKSLIIFLILGSHGKLHGLQSYIKLQLGDLFNLFFAHHDQFTKFQDKMLLLDQAPPDIS